MDNKVKICANKEEVISSDFLWDVFKKLVGSIDKYSTEYYSSIAESLQNNDGITEREYKDMKEFLKDKEVWEKAKKIYSNVQICMPIEKMFSNVEYLLLPNIIQNIKIRMGQALYKNLSNTGEHNKIYDGHREKYITVRNNEDEEAIVGIIMDEFEYDEDIIYHIKYEDNTYGIIYKGKILVGPGKYIVMNKKELEGQIYYKVHMGKDENTKLGILDIKGEEMFGEVDYENIIGFKSFEREKYLLGQKNGKYGLVDIEGNVLFGGFKWLDIGNILSKKDGSRFLEVREEESISGLADEDGNLSYGGIEWQSSVNFIDFNGKLEKELLLVQARNNQGVVDEDGNKFFGGLKWTSLRRVLLGKDGEKYCVVERKGLIGLVTMSGEEIYGGVIWPDVIGFIDSPDGESFLKVTKEKSNSGFIDSSLGLVDKFGKECYVKKCNKIYEFVTCDDEIYLFVYDHADAYCLSGILDKECNPVFGGVGWDMEKIEFFEDKNGKKYLKVKERGGGEKFVDKKGKRKGIFTKVTPVE